MLKALIASVFVLLIAAPCTAEPLQMGFLQTSLGTRVQSYIAKEQRMARVIRAFAGDELRMRALYPMKQLNLTKYGFDVLETKTNDNTRLVLRGGVSKVSSKAAAGMEVVISW